MIHAVVFDLGEVLSSAPTLADELGARLGVAAERVAEQYWIGRAPYDAGGSAEEYWTGLLERLGLRPDDRLAHELALLDAGVWARLRPTAHALLRDCRAAGVAVAVLSNSPHAMQTVGDAAPWRPDVDHLFVSATLGLMKPDIAIYREAAARLGLPGGRIAFIDDRPPNVDGALAAGWCAHLFVDDADSRRWLESLGVLRGPA